MVNKIIHKHSNVVNNNKPKLPTKDQLEYGEIAINYAKGNETISLKNSSDEIIEFKSKNYVDEQINSNNERIQAVEDSIDLVNETIEDNELVTATAITKLEGRTTNVENGLTNKSDIGHTHVSSAITDSISASGSITSTASSLVQGKAVYNYAAPKSHASSSTTYGAATTSNYGHVKISNGDVATVASANGLAAGMDHTHSNYSTTGHTHDIVSSSENGFAPKVSDGGTIDNSNNDLVLTSDNGTIGWRKLPANAFKDTDTKVTAPSNHYIPTGDTNYKLTVNASGATSAWNIDVVKGVSVERDAKGHITNLSVTSGKIPNNPNTDTKVIQTPTTNNGEYPVLLAQSGQTGTTTGTTYFDSGITINPSTNTIKAKASSVSKSLTVKLNSGDTEGTNKFTFDGSGEKIINITPSSIGAATTNDINTAIAEVIAEAPENFDTLKEIADWIGNDTTGAADMANDITELKGTVSGYTSTNKIKTAIDRKAPTNHASSATTYGVATTSNYGHVKISNGDVATVASDNGLVAGMDHTHSNYSPTGHTHVSSAITDSISSMTDITGTATRLVQGKAVYELINDTEQQIAETLLEHDTRINDILLEIEDNELVTATAITNLEERTTNVENGLTNKSDIGHIHVSSAITDSISASGSITSSASGLVQGKAVYNYAAPKSHASSATTYGIATTSNYGHVKIGNGLTVSNGVLSHPTTSGNKHIPSGGTSGQFLKYTSSGTAAWATPANNTATSAAAGFMSAEDKTKLDRVHDHHKLTIDTSDWDGVGTLNDVNALVDDVDKFTYIKFGDIIRICSSEEFENLGYPSNPYRNLSTITVKIGEISYRLRCVNVGYDDFDVQSSSMFGAGFNNFQLGDNDYTFYNTLYKFGGYLDVIIVGFDDNVSNGWLYVPIYNSHIGYISNISQTSKSIQVTSTTENATHPLVFTKSVPTGNKSLYTDSANSLHYNPSTDTLTVPTASTTTMKASTIANKTSGSTIMFNDCIKMKTSSYVQGLMNFKGLDHNNDVLSISGGSTTSAPSITIKTKNNKDYVGISMLGKADTTSVAEIKVYGTSTSSYTTIQGGKNAVVTSDERLKDFGDNIEVDFNELKQIPKKYFTWKNDDIKVSNIGTSAQSIEKLYPELVITDDNGYKSLDYSTLSIIALAAIDKLNERIEYLENKLKENEMNNL